MWCASSSARGRDRGVSQLLALIILILLVISSGSIFYAFFTRLTKGLSQNANFEVQSLNLVTTPIKNQFSVTIKNTGNTKLYNVQVELRDISPNAKIIQLKAINPGKTNGKTIDITGKVSSGLSYPVIIEAHDSNGNPIITKTTVVKA